MLQTMVLQVPNPLQDGRVVFGVWVDDPFGLAIEVLLEHLLLDIHDLLENNEDVRLGVGNAVQCLVLLLDSWLKVVYSLVGW